VSVRACTTRLVRAEKLAAAQRPSGRDRPELVVVSFDEQGVARFVSVCGPWQGCVSCGWPKDAYEPFAGDEADLEAYYVRHGWQPDRTIVLQPHLGSGRGKADHET
jgi:hypothetical protein